MSKQHTPTPYKFQGKSKNGNHFNVVGTKLGGKHKICIVPFVPNSVEDEQEAESIAKFIVKACNSHDKLVDALTRVFKALGKCTVQSDDAVDAYGDARRLLTELKS